jgi:hypothetical protein
MTKSKQHLHLYKYYWFNIRLSSADVEAETYPKSCACTQALYSAAFIFGFTLVTLVPHSLLPTCKKVCYLSFPTHTLASVDVGLTCLPVSDHLHQMCIPRRVHAHERYVRIRTHISRAHSAFPTTQV